MTDLDIGRIRSARQLCFFAHYDAEGIVADHVLRYLDAIVAAGFETVVVSTAKLEANEVAKVAARGLQLVCRDNQGMDFGGWIEMAIRGFPITADLLLLANDSVYAPVGDFKDFVDRLLAVDADFYGAVETAQVAPHLQSWFLLLRPAAFRSDAFATLMLTPMPTMASKAALIERYEVGLTRALVATGLRYHAGFSPLRTGSLAVRHPYNPAHLLWRDMLRAGVPFIKVELLRFNLLGVSDANEWRDEVRRRAPFLLSMIETDLIRRGTRPGPGYLAMSDAAPVYWPEVRPLLIADHRGSPALSRWRTIAFRALTAAIWYPRRACTKLRARAGAIGRD